MKHYRLHDQWFFCERANHAVFLDLKRERYLALAPSDALQLRAVLENGAVGADALKLAQALESEGLLVQSDKGSCAQRVPLIAPVSHTFWAADELLDRVSFSDLRNFVHAWIRATLMLRMRSLYAIARRLHERKARAVDISMPEESEVRARCRAFYILHPIFTKFRSPLARSLALLEFLARYEIYPSWVFGVRLQPFDARSWVQQGGMLLDATPEAVEKFTPIMIV